ncbi:MAG: DUF2877 domain-containing protein [Chloroflexi bacterium]|nr:DUF2877 domain-containing protein [Chloroflexota bacterium]
MEILSLSPAAKAWLQETRIAHVLHVFDPVCNLINDEGEVLSLVDARVGNGPFSAVVARGGFTDWVSAHSGVLLSPPVLMVGDGIFKYFQAKLWMPQPDWTALREELDGLQKASKNVQVLLSRHAEAESFAWLMMPDSDQATYGNAVFERAKQAIGELLRALMEENIEAMRAAASQLAGLGSGLTPAGDDVLVGMMHALWATRPEVQALALSLVLAEAAAPRTNSLSAAWLLAAGRGEAGEAWHELFAAIAAKDAGAQEAAVMRILPTGHSSGADALGGFAAMIQMEAQA